ncbi:hypothetical protein R3P38DRAFT_2824248 [Favolaschia claudopus]|uniref:Uncharacterized protein n=1 Tax=Favolaschia claudopus TaxID=2862362 RepID=A0AAW0EK22_9AGAR
MEVLVHRSFLRFRLLLCLVVLFSTLVAGQSLINGQTFTNGLAIIDAPAPQNPGHAGSNINIALDVSGNGKLPASARLPNSGLPTGFGSLQIYLVSAQTNVNVTVSADPGFLSSEPGSTVKHLNWPIPTCIPAGDYNLTFYESSQFNGQGIFTITPIPIPISNPNPSGPCPDNLNALQAQPQSSNPLSESPFAPGSSLSASSSSPTSTVSSTPTRMVTVISGSPVLTLTLTLSDGVLNLPTVTVTSQPSPTTIVVVSTDIVTQTLAGTVTTFTQTSTLTTVVTPSSQPNNVNNSPGFFPVNAAPHSISSVPRMLCFLFGVSWTLLLYSSIF